MWLREGIPLPPGLCRLRASRQGGRCQLTVSGVRPSDQATYTCHAVNAAGESSTFTRIVVLERELLLAADGAITRSVSGAGDGTQPRGPELVIQAVVKTVTQTVMDTVLEMGT